MLVRYADIAGRGEPHERPPPPASPVPVMTFPTPSETPVPSTGVHVRVAGLTDVGITRAHNEDAFAYADLTTGRDHTVLSPTLTVGLRGMVFVVADGMGGAAAGEIASAMAVEAVLDTFLAQWVPALSRTPDALIETLRDAADTANHRIYAYAGAHPEHMGMGTTATIAVLLGDELFLAQVGDSRAYIVRDGVARQITKDQSLMQKLIEAGELTEEEAEVNDRRNIILQALGPDSTVRADLTRQLIARGDTLVLCSDGLTTHLRAQDIARIVTQRDEPAAACEGMIAMANSLGGHDNITVVVARFDGEQLGGTEDERRALGYHSVPQPEAQVPTLDRLRGRMRSGAVPAVPRAITPPGGTPVATGEPTARGEQGAAGGASQERSPERAGFWVVVFAALVLTAWLVWKFVLK
jgi:PPM family protein phosphatase